jgi:DNA topoisomerase-1
VGTHPDDGEPIVASPGRFGPYVKHGGEFRSLASDDQIFTISLDEAVDLLRQPKRSRRRQSATKKVLRELGLHPETGRPIQMLDGRYGPYVTDGTTNASLSKGSNPGAVSMDEAVELLKARADAGPTKKRRAARSPRRKLAGVS